MSITEELLDDDADGHHRDSRQGLYEALIGEPIGKCQPRPAICVNPETSVADAIDLMKAHGMGCVLIVRGGELTGIFTERDVLFRVAAARRDATTTRVGEVMTADPETLTLDDELAWVLNLMAVGGFRHVPIVDAGGHPVGVLSVKHIVERLVELFPRDVLNLPPHPGKDITRTREGA